uniref:Uncharacterized protein n=1 Tax=Rhizophora mucronata TaxID=61149 RepID=A0A2P2PQZ7_RHIMU
MHPNYHIQAKSMMHGCILNSSVLDKMIAETMLHGRKKIFYFVLFFAYDLLPMSPSKA